MDHLEDPGLDGRIIFFIIIFIGMLHYIIISNATCYLH
jgi:hypothetical protein